MNINRTEYNVQDSKRFSDTGIPKTSPSLAQNSVNIQDQRAKSISEEQQEKMMEQVKKLNQSIASSGKELKFKYNEEAEQLYVEVLDARTKEVVTSLPPEFLIDLSIKMKEMIGMFMDEKI
ncbi:MAG: flagellar protein FlaG [Paenibacillus sp.]|uniref:Flagellar protein FlaG n=1 Tax=Paenibacillus timonensis TaxID=225915 RepID=A0ABW3SC08_9BACL|nr:MULTISPECIES: flagellar protein FlaG [Paenibacillus]MCH1640508.1 flagellar protein FlaG [Paenibacillus timonensis]MDU2242270.1 flagellar protein FlaG [Paenibacillus sp.]MDU4695601.1 flagellar protein FlaG [Paenibacillus sp.]